MNEDQLNRWIEGFNNEMGSIQTSFDAFFIQKRIESYYTLKVDKKYGNLILEMNDEDELPNDIINRIREAYKKSKPAV